MLSKMRGTCVEIAEGEEDALELGLLRTHLQGVLQQHHTNMLGHAMNKVRILTWLQIFQIFPPILSRRQFEQLFCITWFLSQCAADDCSQIIHFSGILGLNCLEKSDKLGKNLQNVIKVSYK